MESKYKIDYYNLLDLLTPTFLRRPIFRAWLRCLIAPIVGLYRSFTSERDNDLYRESIDSTIPRLEYMLNKEFYEFGLDFEYNNRIKINQLSIKDVSFIFLGGLDFEGEETLDEGKAHYLGTLPIHTHSEVNEDSTSFIITVPSNVGEYNANRMAALVRAYALPDKTFEIVNY